MIDIPCLRQKALKIDWQSCSRRTRRNLKYSGYTVNCQKKMNIPGKCFKHNHFILKILLTTSPQWSTDQIPSLYRACVYVYIVFTLTLRNKVDQKPLPTRLGADSYCPETKEGVEGVTNPTAARRRRWRCQKRSEEHTPYSPAKPLIYHFGVESPNEWNFLAGSLGFSQPLE